VQKVMANAHLYAQRLGLKPITLKQRLGMIPGRVATLQENLDEVSTVAEQESIE
jgi:soluble lytic murein transglycosylase